MGRFESRGGRFPNRRTVARIVKAHNQDVAKLQKENEQLKKTLQDIKDFHAALSDSPAHEEGA